ncbi:MAG TPA: hypothetical protein VFA16_19270 [Mycobacterium sp.]|uniref:hypothetical protein n=1 Tax=Mycobacterium sp. TaxID=1785 RepID=UPI002D4097AA|nr:hypothetical protein [Mycobacterium sp.]HZU49369.1 hypothetical protein [Mycobacterium sp.]
MQWSAPGYALLLALLVVGPLLGPGYLLLRDAVSTPRSYLSDTALGLGESAPRATPQDFVVAVASHLLDGGVVVKALLVLALWLAGCGAARLAAVVLPEAGRPGEFVAITLATWNPYVAERLLQGHWSLLFGYGCLPWIATAMLGLRLAGGRRRFFALAFWVALAGLTPTGLIVAATVALVCATTRGSGYGRWLCVSATVAVAVVAALPWLTASVLGPSWGTRTWAQAPAVAVFAPRAEPGLGTLGSLASLGGIWNAEAVPTSRTTIFAVVAAVALLAMVATGLPVVLRRAAAVPLLMLAAAAVLGPALLATGPGLALLRALVDAVPALAVVRDGQKWVALAMPGYALAGAGAVVTLQRWLRPAVTAVACCVALIAGLPDLCWGVGGKMQPVHYPVGWPAVSALINQDPGPVAVLPAGTMRRFSWSGRSPVLDPLPRWLRADVLTTGDLTVSGVTVAGEGAHARAVQGLLLAGADPGALRDAGVAWLVVESGTAGDMGAAARTLDLLRPVYRDADMALYRVGGHRVGALTDRRIAVLVAHLAWLTLLVGGAVGMAVTGRRHVRPGSTLGEHKRTS